MKTFKIVTIVVLLSTLTTPVFSGENERLTIRDKNYHTEGYINNRGTLYNKNYKVQGYIRNNGKIYDSQYKERGYIDGHRGRFGRHGGHNK